jgi:PDZ domain-containing protein
MTFTTEDPIVPAPSRSWQSWIVGGLALVIVGTLVFAAVVPLPYYALEPGTVRPTSDLVAVDGAEVHRPRGSIFYTTVRISQSTLLEVIGGWLDSDVDVLPREVVLGDRDPDENRTYNRDLMNDSKLVATEVALAELGYPIIVNVTGMVIVSVGPEYPSSRVLEAGDVIVAVDGQRIDEREDLMHLLSAHEPGDEVTVTIEPYDADGEEDLTVELSPAADDPARPIIGVQVQPRDLEYDLPFDVAIDSGNVGGPSAGLAFTLSIIDVLTEGELTGGEAVAVTGTIEPDGTVGPVGGVVQKIAAVRDAGIKILLVPADEYEEARAHAGSVQVYAVDDLDEALATLARLGGNGLALGRPGEAVPS